MSRFMVFDWDKAAQLIKENNPSVAEAGLEGDWGHTSGVIYGDGNPIGNDPGLFLLSEWATPTLAMDDECVPCYRMQDEVPEWDENTVWPKSALDILGVDCVSNIEEDRLWELWQDIGPEE